MTVYKWLQVADNNASVDSTINWVEGQAPSTVNNSARAVMAAIAKMRDDLSGRLVAGGTATAYTITSNQGFDTLAHMDGMALSFKVTLTNGSPVTLNVDSLGAKPLRVSPGVELTAGNLTIGVSYGVTYSNTDGAWYFQDGALTAATILSPILVPVGGVIMWMGATLPSSSWFWCNGTTLTAASYPALAAVLPAAFVSAGVITLPNLCEVLPYGVAGMGGVGGRGSTVTNSTTLPNAANWNKLGAGAPAGFIGESAHTLAIAELAQHQHTGAINNGSVSVSGTLSGSLGFATNTAGQIGSGLIGLQGGSTAISTSGTLTGGVADPNFTTSLIGSSNAHNTTPPAYPIGFIIRVL